MKKILLCILLFPWVCYGSASSAKREPPAKSYGWFASLGCLKIDSGELKLDSTMEELDAFYGSKWTDMYADLCRKMLDGPGWLVLASPQRVGSKMVIGFTEETEIHTTSLGTSLSQQGRFVFYWDEKYLRSSFFTTQKYDELAKNYHINTADASPFAFPELKRLAALPQRIGHPLPPSMAPEIPDSILLNKSSPSEQREPKRSSARQTFFLHAKGAVERIHGTPWMSILGWLALALAIAFSFRKWRLNSRKE